MATAPAPANLPLFYKDLVPLSSVEHADFHARALENAEFLVGQHAIPLTSDEFVSACRFYPIVFSAGENPVPLALMGLNEGINTFVDDQGKLINPVYVPAYVRRYPFLLARLQPDSEDLSLCFDPTSGALGKFDEGDALFSAEAHEGVVPLLAFAEPVLVLHTPRGRSPGPRRAARGRRWRRPGAGPARLRAARPAPRSVRRSIPGGSPAG